MLYKFNKVMYLNIAAIMHDEFPSFKPSRAHVLILVSMRDANYIKIH